MPGPRLRGRRVFLQGIPKGSTLARRRGGIPMVAPFSGGCLCGAVRYEVSAEPVAFMLCHCRDCQYVSGGEPAAVVVVPAGSISILKGGVKGFAVKGESGSDV